MHTHTLSHHGITAHLSFSVTSSTGTTTDWTEEAPGKLWKCSQNELLCKIRLHNQGARIIYQLSITNLSPSTIAIESFRMGPESIRWDAPLTAPHALYSLHPRKSGTNDYDADEVRGLNPLSPLPAHSSGEWHELTGRSPELPHLEALVLTEGPSGISDAPCIIEGALSQNHAHQRNRVRWSDAQTIEFDTRHTFMGIPSRPLAPAETLTESGYFEIAPKTDLNENLRGYLQALTISTGTRGDKNPLTDQRFFCTWNNFVYWEANEKEVLASVKSVKKSLPSIDFYLLDDGYMISQGEGTTSRLERNAEGKRRHTLDRELPWFHNCPGISFLFDDGAGVDPEKFPDGLDGFARKVRAEGLRPAIWIGMEVSRHAPVAIKHPEWFIDIGHESHLLPDLSVPEMRAQLRKAFKTLFIDWGFEAVKIDFVTHLTDLTHLTHLTHLTDHPNLQYHFPDKSGAEWRQWLFETIREYLPEDGFITIGCWICMGAPWMAPWIDSYRDSMDARDGNWQTVLSNVRWSILPSLCGGANQPIPDADTVCAFDGLNKDAMQTWVNYARVGGMLVEAGGDILEWSDDDLEWIEESLANDTSGGRVYFADQTFWSRDGLPCATYRKIKKNTYLLGLYNWTESDTTVTPNWTGTCLESATSFTFLETGETFTRDQLLNYPLPAQGSALFVAHFTHQTS